MHTHLLLTLLALLPVVFSASDLRGTPTLVFQSHFDDEMPWVASVEVDRQNNIKGERTLEWGRTAGSVPPKIVNGTLHFYPSPLQDSPGFGGGVAIWAPFRLDHNTVWDDEDEPVEDNGWVFSFRANWLFATVPPSSGGEEYLTPWQVVMSFPTSVQLANLAIAVRSLSTHDEVGVFLGSDPTYSQSRIPRNKRNHIPNNYEEFGPRPAAVWTLPTFSLAFDWRSFVLYVPMPDRTENPVVRFSFVIGVNDLNIIPFTWNSVQDLIHSYTESWRVWYDDELDGAAPWWDGDLFNFTLVEFDHPNNTNLLGEVIYEFEIVPNHPDLATIARYVAERIGEDLEDDILDDYDFEEFDFTYRLPGLARSEYMSLWVDGVELEQDQTDFEGLILENFFQNSGSIFDTVSQQLDDWYNVDGNTDYGFIDEFIWFSVEDNTDNTVKEWCRSGYDFTPAVLDGLARGSVDSFYSFGGPDEVVSYTSEQNFDVTQHIWIEWDKYGYGGIVECSLYFTIRVRENSEGIDLVTTNTDSLPDDAEDDQLLRLARRQFADNDQVDPFEGPYVVIGGAAGLWDDEIGPNVFLGTLQDIELDDIKIYTTSAEDLDSALSETFLRILVECGDGERESYEECDAADPSCTSDCTCPLRTIPMAPMGCTLCGNGRVDYLDGEVCDYAEDPNCADDCMGCAHPDMILDEDELPSNGIPTDRHGRCTFCGNGQLDLIHGEICDTASDENCDDDCGACSEGYFPTGNEWGTCFLCGNGVLDGDEVCDTGITSHLCASDCSGCQIGYVPDWMGDCIMCGNGVIDDGEICDPALTSCNPDCQGCDDTHVPGPEGCTRCGNGYLDGGEECDAFYEGCADDCSGCDAGLVPAGDVLGLCTMCGNGVLDEGEMCDSDENCVDCMNCQFPYILSAGGACLTCGNGMLDEGEACDSTQTGCESHCQMCEEGFEAVIDFDANPTGLCFPATCEDAPLLEGEPFCFCE